MSPAEVTKAVVLARGLGTRMRRSLEGPERLDPLQTRMADQGIKAMIPVERPFLDYLLSGLADAGCGKVCLVIGPEHRIIPEYYSQTCPPTRLEICFAFQQDPRGTADALAAAETFAGKDHFLALNSDNYYPVSALRALRLLKRPGLAVFDRQSLIREGNIGLDRVRQFAVVSIDSEGYLRRIVEKPEDEFLRTLGSEVQISMNCWIFGPAIFPACAAVTPSKRGELELTDAVRYAMHHLDERFQVLRFRAGVLDLSNRSDIKAVADRLRGIEVNL